MSEPISEATPETNPPAAGADEAQHASPVDGAEAKALRALVRWVAVEVFLYVIVALGLVFLALRRGRLSDAILVMLTLLITTPMILSYRQQALERLRGGRLKPVRREEPAPAEAPSAEPGGTDPGDVPPPSAG